MRPFKLRLTLALLERRKAGCRLRGEWHLKFIRLVLAGSR
jgi:hypothetical protein